jgi:hypothetical protein
MIAIPVICDRCRAEGLAGAGDFAGLGDLLDFEPVPLQLDRVDGWKPECQRAFIAAVAVLGSSYRAARAIGKSATGAERLRTLAGAEGFNAAWEKAKAISQEQGTLRLANSLRGLTAPAPPVPSRVEGPASPKPPARPEPEAADEQAIDRAQFELLAGIAHEYGLKLLAERRSRLDGKIAEADFYLRQITMLEVSLDVVSGDGMAVLRDARRGEYDLLDIAETAMSKLLDEVRRRHWQVHGAPPRPEYPPRHLLEQHDGFATEPMECARSGLAESLDDQWRAFADRHARDAEAQIEWEARARLAWEASEHGPRAPAAEPPSQEEERQP